MAGGRGSAAWQGAARWCGPVAARRHEAVGVRDTQSLAAQYNRRQPLCSLAWPEGAAGSMSRQVRGADGSSGEGDRARRLCGREGRGARRWLSGAERYGYANLIRSKAVVASAAATRDASRLAEACCTVSLPLHVGSRTTSCACCSRSATGPGSGSRTTGACSSSATGGTSATRRSKRRATGASTSPLGCCKGAADSAAPAGGRLVGETCPVAPTALVALLDDPARALAVLPEERQPLLDALAVHEGRCRLVRDLLTANLAGRAEAKNGSATPQLPYALHEAAGLLLKSPAWLRRQAQAGAIPCAKKIGRSWVFPRAAFHRFCQRRQVG